MWSLGGVIVGPWRKLLAHGAGGEQRLRCHREEVVIRSEQVHNLDEELIVHRW